MKEIRDNTWGRGVYLRCPVQCTVQFSLRNATRVLQSTYVFVKGERSWARIYKLFRTPGISSKKWADWFRKAFIFLLYSHYYISTYAGGIDSLEFFALLKSLKIRALENYVCLLSHTLLIPSGLNLCQIVKKVHKTLDTLIFIPNIDSSTEHQ
jgi:hypothetical protein